MKNLLTQWTSYRGSSRRKSSYRGSNHRRLSHWKCSVDEKKDDRSIGKKPPNPVGTKEENRCSKLLVSRSIFRCGQWYVKLDDDHTVIDYTGHPTHRSWLHKSSITQIIDYTSHRPHIITDCEQRMHVGDNPRPCAPRAAVAWRAEEVVLTWRSLEGSSLDGPREVRRHWKERLPSSLWRVMIIFRRGRTANAGSQVLSYLFSFWLSPSLPFRPLPRHHSLNLGDQVTSLRHRLSTSLTFEPLSGHQSLDIGDQDNFSLPSPLPGSGERVKAEAAPERQLSGRWPASDSFAKCCSKYRPSRALVASHSCT